MRKNFSDQNRWQPIWLVIEHLYYNNSILLLLTLSWTLSSSRFLLESFQTYYIFQLEKINNIIFLKKNKIIFSSLRTFKIFVAKAVCRGKYDSDSFKNTDNLISAIKGLKTKRSSIFLWAWHSYLSKYSSKVEY